MISVENHRKRKAVEMLLRKGAVEVSYDGKALLIDWNAGLPLELNDQGILAIVMEPAGPTKVAVTWDSVISWKGFDKPESPQ